MVTKRLTTIGSLSAVAIAAHTVANLNALRKPNVVAPALLEKISVLIPARNEADNILRAVSSVLASIGVPNLEKTAPKKLDAATNTIIKAEISKVLTKASCNFLNVNFLYAKANNKEPIAPQPA